MLCHLWAVALWTNEHTNFKSREQQQVIIVVNLLAIKHTGTATQEQRAKGGRKGSICIKVVPK